MIGLIGILGLVWLIPLAMLALQAGATVYQAKKAKDAADNANAHAKEMQKLQHKEERRSLVEAKGQSLLEARVLRRNENEMRRQVAASIAYQNLQAEWANQDKDRVKAERYSNGNPTSGT